ncbi:MFS transporter [Luedemannella helvata]|uniref:MFS transporter n=1 Tax=Luedemannella helvata TaxID=349315 RepID=UPI003CD06902
MITKAPHPSTVPDRARVARVQRRTLWLLSATQVVGGVGMATGIAVGALLAADLGGVAVSGFAQSALVVGAALLALPVARVMRGRGRRPGLTLAYLVGALGAALVVVAAARGSLLLLFAGLFLFGGGSAANLQVRYAAMDLAPPDRRGRHLSIVVWAATVGAVAGPNLAPWADKTARGAGQAGYTGPFAVSVVAFALAMVLVWALLRPDPLVLARAVARTPENARTVSAPRRGFGAALREIAASPRARAGLAALTIGHTVMIAVMTMTPVHIGEQAHGDVLRVVGIVLSLHIAGMYGVSLVTGWLTDRIGRPAVILVGVGLQLTACAVAGTAGHDPVRLGVGLTLLGMGWSGTMVAGSTLLSESVGDANRPAVQGLSDLIMGLSGATAGALSGLVLTWTSYPTLTLLAAVLLVPLLAAAVRLLGVREGAVTGATD